MRDELGVLLPLRAGSGLASDGRIRGGVVCVVVVQEFPLLDAGLAKDLAALNEVLLLVRE